MTSGEISQCFVVRDGGFFGEERLLWDTDDSFSISFVSGGEGE